MLLTLRRAGGDTSRFLNGTSSGHLDLPRARAGGLSGGLFAIFVPDPEVDPNAPAPAGWVAGGPLHPAYAAREAWAMLEILEDLEARSAGQVRICRTVEEIRACMATGTLAAGVHLEGAEPIDASLANLEAWYARGLRSIGLVWSRPNAFAHGVPFTFPGSPDVGPGLTTAGRELVRACNRLGIVVDLAHLNDAGFRDVARISDAPLVVSHADMYGLCPTSRNMTDEQLAAVAASGGIVGIAFCVAFLRADGVLNVDTPIARLVEHIRYAVDRAGIDHVGLGSDFDGAKIPAELGDAAGLPKLIAALREDGFREAEIRKLTSENWLRVLGDIWRK